MGKPPYYVSVYLGFFGSFYRDKGPLVTKVSIFKSFLHKKNTLKNSNRLCLFICNMMQVIPLLASLGNITCDKPDVIFVCVFSLDFTTDPQEV